MLAGRAILLGNSTGKVTACQASCPWLVQSPVLPLGDYSPWTVIALIAVGSHCVYSWGENLIKPIKLELPWNKWAQLCSLYRNRHGKDCLWNRRPFSQRFRDLSVFSSVSVTRISQHLKDSQIYCGRCFCWQQSTWIDGDPILTLPRDTGSHREGGGTE